MGATISVPKLTHVLVAKTDVAVIRPALERARFECECCGPATGLRVLIGLGETIVLCPRCRETDGFELVYAARMRARNFAARRRGP